MYIIIIIIGLLYIIWEESNKNVLNSNKKLLEMKLLIDKERQLREDIFSGKYLKK